MKRRLLDPWLFLVAVLALPAAPVWAQDEEEVTEEEATEEGAAEEEPETVMDDGGSGGLGQILQGLSWGASHEEVLEFYQNHFLEEYREEIAGMRDSLEINEIRNRHEQRYTRLEGSYETFEGSRTGYEVSLLGGEVAPGNEETMLTVRDDNAILYYVFQANQLFKILVAYNAEYLGGISFESFLEQVERRYGPAEATEFDETDTGDRYLARAAWHDDGARLRIENQSNVFGTFCMVFTSPEIEDRVVGLRGGNDGDSSNGVVVTDLVRQLSEDRGDDYSGAADNILGNPTHVELVVPQRDTTVDGEPVPHQGAISEPAEGTTAEEEDDDDDDDRRRRRHRDDDEEEEDEEEGITIY